MKKIMIFALMIVMLFGNITTTSAATATTTATKAPIPITNQEVKALLTNAFNVQLALNNPLDMVTIKNLMNGYFVPQFTEQFIKERVTLYAQDNYGNKLFYVPGSGDFSMFVDVQTFTWTNKTKITYSKDYKYVTIAEYIPAGEDAGYSWDAYTYIVNLTRTNDGYRIANMQYK